MRPGQLFRDPCFAPAFRSTAILFAVGFLYLEVVGIVAHRPDSPPIGTQAFPASLTAIGFAAALIAIVLRVRAWRPIARVGTIAVAFVGIVCFQSLLDTTYMWIVGQELAPAMRRWAQVNLERLTRASFIYFWIYGANLALVLNAIANQRMNEQRRELAEARAAASQAQLAMLRYQLNPHFLFNTLNAISSLVMTGRGPQAEDMLSKLSSFLRASLASEAHDYVQLAAELDVIQDYLEIERVRFGERLNVEFTCQPDVSSALMPSFLLQPLVENAIKYAVSPARRPVTIKIDAHRDGDDLLVVIADDGDGAKAATRSGTGVGLRNVRERLRTLYGDRGVLEAVPLETGFLAVVRLPRTTAPSVAISA